MVQKQNYKNSGKLATIIVYNFGQSKGVVDMNKDGQVNAFREKSDLDGDLINIGFMVIEPAFLGMIETMSLFQKNMFYKSQQKFPFIVECSKDNEYSVRQMLKNIHENEPYILVKKKLDLMDIKIDGLSVPYVADKLLEDKKKIENELLTLFGLNNVIDKKERLIVDEANANNDYINRNVDLLYKNRKQACDEINKKFGLNINVKRVNNIEEKFYNEGGEINE